MLMTGRECVVEAQRVTGESGARSRRKGESDGWRRGSALALQLL